MAKAKKDMWTDLPRLTAIAKRHNEYIALFPSECYQLNPYTKKSLTYVTGKIGEKPPVANVDEIPGYDRIKCLYQKAYIPPMCKCYLGGPQTETQRHGWFNRKMTSEDYDQRFVYTHRTPDFIKTQMQIKAYDRMMKGLDIKM